MDRDNKAYSLEELYGGLGHCKEGTDEEYTIYKKIVEILEPKISNLRDDLETDVYNPETGDLLGRIPSFLDEYAAPMDNMANIYICRGLYDVALGLLEQVLPIYRILEIYNPNYTYQRRNAIISLIKCYENLGKENLAVLYGYELKHLERDVLYDKKI